MTVREFVRGFGRMLWSIGMVYVATALVRMDEGRSFYPLFFLAIVMVGVGAVFSAVNRDHS